MEKLKMHTPNLTQENIARIRELFPGCVTEARGEDGKLRLAMDFDQLKQELSDSIVLGQKFFAHVLFGLKLAEDGVAPDPAVGIPRPDEHASAFGIKGRSSFHAPNYSDRKSVV